MDIRHAGKPPHIIASEIARGSTTNSWKGLEYGINGDVHIVVVIDNVAYVVPDARAVLSGKGRHVRYEPDFNVLAARPPSDRHVAPPAERTSTKLLGFLARVPSLSPKPRPRFERSQAVTTASPPALTPLCAMSARASS